VEAVERLAGPAEVLAATGGDRFARNTVRPESYPTTGWRTRDAVAWVGFDAEEHRPYLQALGTPDAVHAVLAVAVREVPPGLRGDDGSVPATVPAAAAAGLGGRLRVEFSWRFRACTTPPAEPAVPTTELAAAGDDRVTRLLRRSVPFTSAWPGDPAVRRWVVVEDGADVVACAADTSAVPGLGHMGAVAVAPEARRRGLGAAVVGRLTRDLLLAGGDAVVVGVLESEPAAQRLYDALGFVTEHTFRSGPLAGG
jgi:ribosomal protein S18 acetylase RimI-like enzyme